MLIARPFTEDFPPNSKKGRVEVQPTLNFFDKDKVGTLQPHDDALVVSLRIEGYDVKRVLVDQGNSAEIMYPNLFRGLNFIVVYGCGGSNQGCQCGLRTWW